MDATRRVLLVDDDHLILRTTSRWLRRRGFDVVAVASGERALATVGPFFCAVFDIDLPDGSGIEFAARMLASGVIRAVVFFSGSADTALRQRAETVGRFVGKGAGMGELAVAIAATPRQSGIRSSVEGLTAIAGIKD
jgi:CheY-like chemotaxis protein